MTDIKQILATALTDEPPPAIDKAAIRRAGKRKVATRYASIATAAVVAAVVIAVPTAMNLGGGVGGGGPDAGQASTAATRTSTLRDLPPPQTKPLDPGLSDQRAEELTGILRDSGALPAMQTHSPAGGVGPWQFEAWGAFYKAHAEVFDARGSAIVTVDLVARPYQGCEEVTFHSANRTCEVRTTPDGREYKVERGPDVPGDLIRVTAKLPDGRKLEVSAQGIEDRSQGPYHTTPMVGGGPQPMTVDELVKLATVPGLVF